MANAPAPLRLPGLVEATAAIAQKRLDPQSHLDACREEALRLEPDLRAFTCLAQPAPSPTVGPLAGIAVAVKDVIETADLPTAYGSPIYADHRPERDAEVVERVRRLGGSVLGKTVTAEFAWRKPGPTRNPWNLAHSPGGSSSGSAAAVAAGVVPLALGTQTLGSMIRPAAYCGIVGFKPTLDALPTRGVHPVSPTLDHVGLFTRSIADAAHAFDLLRDPERTGPQASAARAGRNGRAPHLALLSFGESAAVEPDQRAALETAAAKLRAAGAQISEVAWPGSWSDLWTLASEILAFEAAPRYREIADVAPNQISAELRGLIDAGSAITVPSYEAAQRARSRMISSLADWIGDADAVMTAPAFGSAPIGLGYTGDPRFCTPWSFSGAPAVTFSIGLDARGLPLGVQLAAAPGEDARLLAVAAWCESTAGRPISRPGGIVDERAS